MDGLAFDDAEPDLDEVEPRARRWGEVDLVSNGQVAPPLVDKKESPLELAQSRTATLRRPLRDCATADAGARSGDPTELALLDMARTAGVDLDPGARDEQRVALFAFDPRRRLMATLDRVGNGLRVHVKGAPEALVPLCAVDDAQRGALAGAVDAMTGAGLRVLAVACRDWTDPTPPDRDSAEAPGLTLLGLVGLLDPPRPEVPAAVRLSAAWAATRIPGRADRPDLSGLWTPWL